MVPTDSSIGRLAVLIGAASTVTVTAMPTMSPTMSPAPTNSEKPSSNPTISLNPTTSKKPSSAPTVSQLPSLTPSAFPTPECYDSTVALKEAIARADGFSTITYPLCPNTVIDLTGPAFGPNTPPPLVFKSRTHIQCGFNGLLSDNCVIKGGDLFQIEFAGGEFFDFDIFDAKVTGVTFEDAGRAALTASIRGNLLIEDCVFQVRETLSFLFLLSPHSASLTSYICDFGRIILAGLLHMDLIQNPKSLLGHPFLLYSMESLTKILKWMLLSEESSSRETANHYHFRPVHHLAFFFLMAW